MSSANETFLSLYRESLFCDLEIVIGQSKFHLHQLIVGNASQVLAREMEKLKMPAGDPISTDQESLLPERESKIDGGVVLGMKKVGGSPWRGQLRCEIRSDLFASYWPELVEYMYSGQLMQLSTSNIVDWFCFSSELEITTLKKELIDWIVTNITKADLFPLLPLIIADSRAHEFLRYAISIIAKNFSDFAEAVRHTRDSNLSYPLSSSKTLPKSPKKPNTTSATAGVPSHAIIAPDIDTTRYSFDWRIFPFHAMRDLLHDKNLFAASEQDVFDTIMYYLEKYENNEADTKEISSLFETVRFERLDYATLEAALAHPLVPKELLSRALMARLAGFEKPVTSNSVSSGSPSLKTSSSNAIPTSQTTSQARSSPQTVQLVGASNEPSPPHSRESSRGGGLNQTPPAPLVTSSASSNANIALWSSNTTLSSPGAARERRRQSYGRLFQWSSDFDTKGVLYYLGTKEYRSEWQNPFTQKLVDITWSSLEKGKPSAIFERDPSECWTQDVPSSWFTVDLGSGRSLRITAYTLRHGGSNKQDLIRNWTLKGSVDGKEFVTLMRHKDDESLSSSFATMTWPISGICQAYRFFKIIQTGHNSSKHNFLSIGGVEFYGELIYDMASVPRFGGPLSTSPSSPISSASASTQTALKDASLPLASSSSATSSSTGAD
jgi:hypothetical protein